MAQVLLTLEDSERRRRYLTRAPPWSLCSLSVRCLSSMRMTQWRPRKSAMEITTGSPHGFAQMAGADCLILLSDVEGLFTADPNKDPNAQFIREVRQITPEIESMAGRSASDVGSGGMTTKILAAKSLFQQGATCASHRTPGAPCWPDRVGARCTWFVPTASPVAARKQWIAGTLRPAGSVTIDAGALRALLEGEEPSARRCYRYPRTIRAR